MELSMQDRRVVRPARVGARLTAASWVVAASLMSASAPALAEDAAEDDGNGEILVTAQKREQRANDVGLTISAVSGDALAAKGIVDIGDLNQVASGFSVGASSSGFPVFSIRGINFNANQLSASPTVTAYSDEAPLPYATMWGGLLLDVDHVEVLKGPQGTLFGQNATGGSINVIAAKPTSTPQAGVDVSVNHWGGVDVQGFVSGPLGDTVRARLAVATQQGGAWQKDYVNGGPKIGSKKTFTGRLLIEWEPSADLKFTLNANGFRDSGQPQAYQFSGYNVQNPAGAYPVFQNYPRPTNARQAGVDPGTPNKSDNYTWQTALRAELNLGEHAQLTSITNYVKSQYDTTLDYDGTANRGLTIETIGNAKTFTQELRIAGDVPGANLHYIVGGFYQHDDLLDAEPVEQFYAYSSLPPNTNLQFSYPQTNRVLAAFANVDFDLSESLTLTGGARYTETKQQAAGCTTGDAGITGLAGFIAGLLSGNPAIGSNYVPGQCLTINNLGATPSFLPTDINVAQKEHNLSWRVGLNYKPSPDTLIYGLVSRGYKQGAIQLGNAILASASNAVTQEKLTAYEVGVKSSLLDRALQVNLAYFHYDYINKQFFTYIPSPIGALSTFVNIPKSKVDGVDAEVTAYIGDHVTLHGSVTYINSKLGPFNGFSINLAPVNFTGNKFNFAPDWSGTFSASYHTEVASGLTGRVTVDGMFNSATNSDLDQSASLVIPAYTVVNAQVGLESEQGWRASLWVRNLGNKYYWTNTNAPGDWVNRLTGMPRTFGGTIGYRF